MFFGDTRTDTDLSALLSPRIAEPARWNTRRLLDGFDAYGPSNRLLVGLNGRVNAARRVFAPAVFLVVEGFDMVVEEFFGPSRPELALVTPFDAIPAITRRGDTSDIEQS